MKFKKGSAEAKAFMARLRSMQGKRKKNPAQMLVLGNPGSRRRKNSNGETQEERRLEIQRAMQERAKRIRPDTRIVCRSCGSHTDDVRGKCRYCNRSVRGRNPTLPAPVLTSQAAAEQSKKMAEREFGRVARLGVDGTAREISRKLRGQHREALTPEREILESVRIRGGLRFPGGMSKEEWRNAIPRALRFNKKMGAGVAPDELAQEFADAGLIQDAYQDTLLDYLNRLYREVRTGAPAPAPRDLRRAAAKIVDQRARRAAREVAEMSRFQGEQACSGGRAPNPIRRRGRNPAPALNEYGLPDHIWRDPGFQRELRAFRRRHGNVPMEIMQVDTPAGSPKYMSAWGHMPEVKYDTASTWSNKGRRVHKFGEGRRGRGRKPFLVSSSERGGKYLQIIGGNFSAGGEWIRH